MQQVNGKNTSSHAVVENNNSKQYGSVTALMLTFS